MKTITPAVRLLRANNPSMFTLTGTNTYIIGKKEFVVVDPGPMEEKHLDAILRFTTARALKFILLTHHHEDHSGGMRLLKEKTSAPVAAWKNSPLSADRPLEDGESLRIEETTITAHHTPGHSEDHLCFFLPDEKAVFTGDLILGEGSTTIGYRGIDLKNYLDSLEKMKNLNADILLPGHGDPQSAGKRIEEMIRHREQRHQEILKCLRQNIRQPEKIVEAVYGPKLPAGLFHAAVGNVSAHLDAIEKKLI